MYIANFGRNASKYEKQKLLKRKVKIGYHVFFGLPNVSLPSYFSLPLYDRWFYTLFSKSIDLIKSQLISITALICISICATKLSTMIIMMMWMMVVVEWC